MAKNDSRLLSGRVKTKSGTSLDTRRSDFLSLDNAEPNFGNPDSDRYILASLADGTRLFLNLNNGFIVNADSVSGDETTFSIDPSGLTNAVGTTLADVLDDLDSAITLAFGSGVIHDNNFNGAGTVESQLSLDSDLRIFGITGDSATFTNITSPGTIDFSGATILDGGVVTTVDINGGTIDGVAIATSDITVGAGKTLDVSSGTLTLSDNQVSGDKVEGGTINSVTVNNLTSGNVNIDGGFIDGTAIGHTTPDSASFTNISTSGAAALASASVADLTDNRVIIAGTAGELEDDANLTYDGTTLNVTNNTASTNSANGALVVAGGVGIGGALNVGGNLEVNGDFTVTGTTTTVDVETLSITDPLIHLADSNESSDEVDIGFIGHYFDAALGGRQHTGIFRDASNDEYYVFAQYQDSALDSSPRSNVIDRTRSSFVLAPFNAMSVTAETLSGTVSADSINTSKLTATNIVGGFIDGIAIGHTTADSGTFTNLARTSPSGVTAGAYGSVTEIPVITLDASGFVDSIGQVSISTTLNTAAETGTGTVNLLDSSLEIAAGEGINTAATGRTITISGEDASTSNKGIASFASGDFDVSSGTVSIKDAGVGNDQLEFDSVTVTAGSGLTGGGSVTLGSSVEIKLDSGAVKGLFSGGNNIDYNNSTGEISASVSGVVAGVYGNSTKIPVISVDSYGQVDSIGLIGAQATLGDTVDSIGFDSATGVFSIVTDVASFFATITLDPYTTNDLVEGDSNKYYTKIRVDSDIDQAFNENPSFGGTGAPFSVANDTKITNLNADKLDGYSFADFMVLSLPAIKTNGDVRFNDDVLLTFGQSDDLRIYHDGSNSYIADIGTGLLQLRTNGTRIELVGQSGAEYMARFEQDGAVKLYHNAVQKLATTSTGVDVTGNVVADGGTIDGQLFVNYSSTSNPAILVTSTDSNSQASPELELYKNSTSSNGHYLGQLKFTGENSTGGKKTYAKITGKILDNTAGTEDGIIEVAFQKAGSNNIAARFRSDRLDLINGTDLNVNGDIFTDSDLSANNITRRNTTVVAGVYGSVTAIPVLTVDASGFVDSVGTTALSTVLSTSAEIGTGSVNLLDSSLEIAAGVGIDTVASGNTVTVEIDSADLYAYFNHDDFFGFVANEHIDHSSVSITAGAGLTGGGTIASDRTFAVGEGTGITVTADAISTNDAEIVHDNLSGFVLNEHINHSGVSITAGKGLTGGGDITTSRTIDIDSANVRAMFSGGTGITYNNGTGAFTTTDGDIVHDNLSGFVLNEHIDHSSVSITAGAGLTGGGDITSSRTLNVVGGDGITASANEIEVTVDDATIELSATDGSGAVRVKDGGVTNAKLQYDSSTIGTTSIVLGGSTTTLAGLTQLDIDNIRIDGNTISSTAGSYMYIDPHPVDSAGTLVILGNLSVEGTTTTIKSTTVTINDHLIVLADSATDNASANGAGIQVNGSNATIKYDGATDRWDFNKPIEVSTVHGALSGNATTATTAGALSSAVTVQLSGDVSGAATFTSAGDTATISTTIQPNSVALGTDTTGNYVASLTAGNLIDLGNNSGEGATPTIDVDLSELTDMTDAAVGTDELVILDAGSQKRKAINEITLGLFNTTNQIALGDDTTGNYVQQGGTSGNGISGSVNSEGGTFTVTSNATNANTGSTIVFRDGSGNFAAGTISAALNGNASTATALASSQNFSLTGDVTASAVGFDGTGAVQLTTAYNPGSIVNADINTAAAIADTKLGTISTADKVANSATTATNANTNSAIVARDGSGNFSAGTISAALNGNASTATNATNSTNVAITNDTTTNSAHYVHFGDATSGNDGVKVSNSKLTFNPSSGVLSVNGVSVATTADLTASTSPNFSVDSSLFASGILTNGEGKAIYYDTTTSKWEGAYNDSSGEFVASHVIVDRAATDVKIASTGIFTLSGGLNANHYYFLSSTAGTATDNPDIEPKVFQPLYYALDANTIDLNIQAPQDTVITAYSSGNNPGEELHGGPIVYTGIPSDERLKENIESIQSNAISIVNELNPVSFDFKDPRSKYYEGQQLGFIAQEISEVIPQSVYTEDDEIQTMMLKPETVIPVLTKAIQELTVTVETLKRRVEELEGE